MAVQYVVKKKKKYIYRLTMIMSPEKIEVFYVPTVIMV